MNTSRAEQFWQRYVQGQSASQKLLTLLVLWLGAVICAVLLQYLALTTTISSFVLSISAPLRQAGVFIARSVTIPAHTTSNMYRSAEALRDLEWQYAQQQARLSELEGIQEENRELRRMLENTDRRYQESVISSPITAYAAALIAAGSEQGVVEGNPVLVGQTVIGRVSTVGPTQSHITLLRDSEVDPLLVQTQRGVTGIVSGTGRDVVLEEVASDAQLEEGDRVVTVGQPGVSKDLFVGIVRVIEEEPAAAVQRARIAQPVDFYEARVVEVVQ